MTLFDRIFGKKEEDQDYPDGTTFVVSNGVDNTVPVNTNNPLDKEMIRLAEEGTKLLFLLSQVDKKKNNLSVDDKDYFNIYRLLDGSFSNNCNKEYEQKVISDIAFSNLELYITTPLEKSELFARFYVFSFIPGTDQEKTSLPVTELEFNKSVTCLSVVSNKKREDIEPSLGRAMRYPDSTLKVSTHIPDYMDFSGIEKLITAAKAVQKEIPLYTKYLESLNSTKVPKVK